VRIDRFSFLSSVVRSVCIGNDSKSSSFCVTSHFSFSCQIFAMGKAC
jgi:hypothetical protein